MPSQGPLSPGTAVDDAGIGTITWTNPGNVTASDDTRATANTTSGGGTSHYIKATNLGFTIPVGATIDGIVVEWERHAAVANVIEDEAVRIVKADVIGSTDKSSVDLWPAADAYKLYGGATDLWGETWTADDINSATFGAALASQNNSGTNRQSRVDHVRITVYYTEVGGQPTMRRWGGSLQPTGGQRIGRGW